MAERPAWSAKDPVNSEMEPSHDHSPMRSDSMEIQTETSFLQDKSTFPIQEAPTLHSGPDPPSIPM